MLSKEGTWDLSFIGEYFVFGLYFATLKYSRVAEIIEA
jgi:hypothetical protein